MGATEMQIPSAVRSRRSLYSFTIEIVFASRVHLSVSAFMNAANSSGVLPTARPPSRSRIHSHARRTASRWTIASSSRVDYRIGVVMASGQLIGAQLGARLAIRRRKAPILPVRSDVIRGRARAAAR